MVKITNPLGLHARAAAQLVRLAAGFKSKILISRNDPLVVADANSIISVLTLAASIGTILNLKVKGEDETEAFDAITDIFRNGFGEI